MVVQKQSEDNLSEGKETSHWHIHRLRKRAILAEHPHVVKLYGTDWRTQFYAYALVFIQLYLAWYCSNSWYRAAVLATTIGPFVDNGILCFMHEATHMLVFKSWRANRIISLLSNSVMCIPISEIFRQHHGRHHQKLGDDNHDVDVPTIREINWVGCSPLRKCLWLTFNMIILPARSLGRLPVHVDAYLIANWIVCIGTGAITLLLSRPAFAFLIVSALNSQGFHPANARMIQRHLHDGRKSMFNAPKDSLRPATYSYYGIGNLFTLNVGYHVEHHDFCMIPWTKIGQLREIAGDKWYPDVCAHQGRGIKEIVNFVFNKNITLADMCAHNH